MTRTATCDTCKAHSSVSTDHAGSHSDIVDAKVRHEQNTGHTAFTTVDNPDDQDDTSPYAILGRE